MLMKETFQLHASIFWTINNFSAHGNLSGWRTKGKFACPCCNEDTWSLSLPNEKKIIWEVIAFCHLIILGETMQKLSIVLKKIVELLDNYLEII